MKRGKKKWRRHRPVKPGNGYAALWRVIDGAIQDAMHAHPEHFRQRATYEVRQSLNKRITGAVHGFALGYQPRGEAGNQPGPLIAASAPKESAGGDGPPPSPDV